jgi:hypothetical protein
MSIVLVGSTSGSVTLQEPAIAGTTVLTLPATSGNVVVDTATQTLTNKSIVATQLTGTIAAARFPIGSVLQVVQGTPKTDKFTTTSSSAVDITGLSVTITPTSASNRILILTNINYGGESNLYGALYVLRNSTNVIVGTHPTGNQIAATFGVGEPKDPYKIMSASHIYLDSPNTTSAITYKVQAASTYNSLQFTINAPFQNDNVSYIIGGTSTITVMEIVA